METHLTIDVLHCLHLGVLMTYCKVVIWLLINGGAWGQHGSQEETFHAAVLAIRVELNQFYGARHRAHPTEGLTRISSFRHKTLGDPSDPKLRAKGAETWGFLLFLVLHCTAKFHLWVMLAWGCSRPAEHWSRWCKIGNLLLPS